MVKGVQTRELYNIWNLCNIASNYPDSRCGEFAVYENINAKYLGQFVKKPRALRGFFGHPIRLKYKKLFHQFVLISLLEQ